MHQICICQNSNDTDYALLRISVFLIVLLPKLSAFISKFLTTAIKQNYKTSKSKGCANQPTNVILEMSRREFVDKFAVRQNLSPDSEGFMLSAFSDKQN